MKDFFSLDTPLMIFLSKLTDLVVLNVICIICCLPVITMGTSFTAMHYVTLKMVKGEEGYIIKSFFKSFKENLKQSSIIWILFLAVSFFVYIDLRIIDYGGLELSEIVNIVVYSIYFFTCITMMYTFPILSRFSNTIPQTIKNALFMSMIHIFKTMLMAAVYVLPLVFLPLHYNFIAVYLLIGLAGPAYVNSFIFQSIFKIYEPGEEAAG